MDINNLFGLPAHPFLVHLPLVAIPLLALAAIAMAVRPNWRARLAVPTAGVGLIVLLTTILAAGAGEKLEGRVGESDLVERHAELGDQLKTIMIVFGILLVVLALLHVVRERGPKISKALPVVAVLCAVVGIGATVWDVRTGHAGSKAVWNDTPAKAKVMEHGERDADGDED